MPADAAATTVVDAGAVHVRHYGVLDGWRGLSIVLVLAAHLLPLGGNGNVSVGLMGMALFFNLSGFLITAFLLKPQATVSVFLIRRIFRIVPLAWLYILVVLSMQGDSLLSWVAHLFFYANLPPVQIHAATDHLWSLCVEMQFYVGIAVLFVLLRKRGLLLLPLVAFAFTALRWHDGMYGSSITWYRIDEILAGSILALVANDGLGRAGRWVRGAITTTPQWLFALLFIASCAWGDYPLMSIMHLRAYFGTLLIGSTLFRPASGLARRLNHPALAYLATISFALYVLHLGLTETWLGSGDKLEKYAKRPLLLATLFILAHLSTFYLERFFIAAGKQLAGRMGKVVIKPVSGGSGA